MQTAADTSYSLAAPRRLDPSKSQITKILLSHTSALLLPKMTMTVAASENVQIYSVRLNL